MPLAMLGTMPGGRYDLADRLILEAATGVRKLTDDELREVVEHVARAGFDPTPDRRGRTAVENHYRKHVEQFREWPDGTTLEQYLASVRDVWLDPRSGIFTSRVQGYWQLAAVRTVLELRGTDGYDAVVAEYRVELGYWVTAFQPEDVERRFLRIPGREQVQWLRTRV